MSILLEAYLMVKTADGFINLPVIAEDRVQGCGSFPQTTVRYQKIREEL
jgi:hypothetical protein